MQFNVCLGGQLWQQAARQRSLTPLQAGVARRLLQPLDIGAGQRSPIVAKVITEPSTQQRFEPLWGRASDVPHPPDQAGVGLEALHDPVDVLLVLGLDLCRAAHEARHRAAQTALHFGLQQAINGERLIGVLRWRTGPSRARGENAKLVAAGGERHSDFLTPLFIPAARTRWEQVRDKQNPHKVRYGLTACKLLRKLDWVLVGLPSSTVCTRARST